MLYLGLAQLPLMFPSISVAFVHAAHTPSPFRGRLQYNSHPWLINLSNENIAREQPETCLQNGIENDADTAAVTGEQTDARLKAASMID